MDPVPTGCDPVDELLGGGLSRGAVTQFYGPPAAGKTNIALSTAIETVASGEVAVYVDTEGVSIDRFRQLLAARTQIADSEAPLQVGAEGTTAPDRTGAESADEEILTDPGTGSRSEAGDPPLGADAEALASQVIVSEAHDADEQAEAIQDATALADRAGVFIVDSATGFYRLERDDDDEGAALRRLTRQVTQLLGVARREECAVLLTNQVYTDPETDRAAPLGGHTLAHWCGAVVRLDRFRGGNRRATLEQHRSRPAGATATFRITEDGFEEAEGPGPGS